MNKTTKKILLHYILAPALLVVLLLLIYKQITDKGDFKAQWQDFKTHLNSDNIIWFVLVLALAPLNWTLEALKWQKLLSRIQITSFKKAFTSMMTGMAFSLVTPNRVGDFAGRILYVAHKNRLKAAIASIIGSTAQMCVTATFGIVGLIFYNLYYPKTMTVIALILAIVLAIGIIWFYLNIEMVARLGWKNKFFRRLRIALRVLKSYTKKDLLIVLVFAFGRFLIYNIQFLLLINVLGAEVPLLAGFLFSALTFWIIAVVPSIAMLELGVRGYAGIFLFVETGLTHSPLPILGGSYALWFINLVIPALLGSLMVLSLRFGKDTHSAASHSEKL